MLVPLKSQRWKRKNIGMNASKKCFGRADLVPRVRTLAFGEFSLRVCFNASGGGSFARNIEKGVF